jgi:ubiquinone/menaquinone biosynthesis C-methylase UbiE
MNNIYDGIESGYYDRIFQKQKGIQSKWHFLKFEALKRVLLEDKITNLLDIACGPGTFIGNLPPHINCTGIDIAREQIAYAEKKYGIENRTFLVSDATSEKLPFEKNTFDAVTCIEFFEHIKAPEINHIIKNVFRCLKPGGIFIATTPNYELLWRFLETTISSLGQIDYRQQHITQFTLPTFRSLFEDPCWEIVTARKYLYLSPFSAIINWKLSSYLFEIEYNHFKMKGNLLMIIAKKGIS